jgi:hypothetical protein
MSNAPTVEEVAAVLGISENETGTYVISCEALATKGSWLLTFAIETPLGTRKKIRGLTPSLTCPILMPTKWPGE